MYNDFIKNICLSDDVPIFLAPMAGITDPPFRELVYSFGASAVVSEMVSAEALVRNSKKTYKRLEKSSAQNLFITQIVGFDPDRMAEAAVINENLGADIIDINMGCPAKKIVSNESGSALMKDENLAIDIIKAVLKSVKIPVTVKMRFGWDNDNLNCFSLASKCEDAGVSMLSIHCRTRAQMYSGHANWAFLKELNKNISIPYLCNGDIKNIEDVKCALKESNANGVMIGRAVLGKPWLLRDFLTFFKTGLIVEQPSIEEQYNIVMRHFESTLDFYGQNRGMLMFRKHFCWYSGSLKNSSTFRENINKLTDINSVKCLVCDFYESNN